MRQRTWLCGILLLVVASCTTYSNTGYLSVSEDYHPLPCSIYDNLGEPSTEEDLSNVQCPIPHKDRVKNHTGIQCVWSSIEMLGRWAEEPKLINPPITSRSQCKSYAGPDSAARMLNQLGVKFEQANGNKSQGLELIKKAMEEGRGALFGVPGHAMVLIHYDEESNVAKFVNNSDSSLQVKVITAEKFRQMWDTWVLVIYADNDIIPYKIIGVARKIPIRDFDNPDREFSKEFIPLPRR